MKKFSSKAIIWFLALTFGVSVFVFGFSVGRSSAQEGIEAKLDIFLQVLDIVRNDYLDKNIDGTKLVYGAIKGFLAALDDPYTRFMEPTAFKEMQIRMKGAYSGIGIYIGMKEKQLSVISPIKNTPAAKAGLKPGDAIVTIDGKSTVDMALEEAVSMIRGPKGTTVKLGIFRKGAKASKEYPVTRDNIKIEILEEKQLSKDIDYIRLNTFENQGASIQIEKKIRAASTNGSKGLILDLRNNGGGLLQNAVEIGSMFIESGPIVFTVDRNGNKESLDSSGGVIWKGPMVVLVNEASASASEILAGALKDTQKATLVGTKTFGKALVQNVRTLSDGSAVLVTIAKYLTPSGDDINKKGIMPDVVVTLTTAEAESLGLLGDDPNPKKDPQLRKAMEILRKEISGRAEL
ncbi:MAG: S41 family peptidase [Candidatus Saganbacteria bacterium]|nr:S41 family peptidase [Candidatus Saganbacteria bacterium]